MLGTVLTALNQGTTGQFLSKKYSFDSTCNQGSALVALLSKSSIVGAVVCSFELEQSMFEFISFLNISKGKELFFTPDLMAISFMDIAH